MILFLQYSITNEKIYDYPLSYRTTIFIVNDFLHVEYVKIIAWKRIRMFFENRLVTIVEVFLGKGELKDECHSMIVKCH